MYKMVHYNVKRQTTSIDTEFDNYNPDVVWF